MPQRYSTEKNTRDSFCESEAISRETLFIQILDTHELVQYDSSRRQVRLGRLALVGWLEDWFWRDSSIPVITIPNLPTKLLLPIMERFITSEHCAAICGSLTPPRMNERWFK